MARFPAINGGYTLEISPPSALMLIPGAQKCPATTATLAVFLMIMPAIVLLVACLNLANLLLARGHLRRQELAVRSSLGGSRGRLTRQILTEGLLLALAGGMVGLLLSTWATDALLASLRPVLPVALSLPELDVDWRVFAGTMAFSLMASLAFGVWPAWALTGRAIVSDLKRLAGAEARQPGGIRMGHALVIGQVALSVLLLASGGLFLASAVAAAKAESGFSPRGSCRGDRSWAGGIRRCRGEQFHRTLLDRLRAVPGVESAALGIGFSVHGLRRRAASWLRPARLRTIGRRRFLAVSDGYRATFGLRDACRAGLQRSRTRTRLPRSSSRDCRRCACAASLAERERARTAHSVPRCAGDQEAGQPIRVVGSFLR